MTKVKNTVTEESINENKVSEEQKVEEKEVKGKVNIEDIPKPAPPKVTKAVDEDENTEFTLTTSLEMFEVKDDIRVRDALFTARDKHFLNDENTLCIFFARGKIDNWCAYIAKQDEDRKWRLYAPTDKYYFERIFYVAYNQDKAYPNRKESAYTKLFNEILHISEIMYFDPKSIDIQICNEIDRIVAMYGEENETYANMLKLALYEIYYGMVAEENKDGTILGRKIKILGLHDMLIKKKAIQNACDCNRNVSVGMIKNECNNLGFSWLSANEQEDEFGFGTCEFSDTFNNHF